MGCCFLTIAASVLLNGCEGGQNAGSSSAASITEADPTSKSSAAGSSPSSVTASSAASVTQSANDYALAASGSFQVSSGTGSRSSFPSGSGTEAESKKTADTSGPKISQSEYDRIQNGMTYAQVKSIIGNDGKLCSELGQKGSNLYTAVYRWEGNGTSGSFANLTFENGKLSSKIQFGLN